LDSQYIYHQDEDLTTDYHAENIVLKVLGINMSPGKRGNTGRIVEAILEGARGKGAETESIYFGGMKVQPCNS